MFCSVLLLLLLISPTLVWQLNNGRKLENKIVWCSYCDYEYTLDTQLQFISWDSLLKVETWGGNASDVDIDTAAWGGNTSDVDIGIATPTPWSMLHDILFFNLHFLSFLHTLPPTTHPFLHFFLPVYLSSHQPVCLPAYLPNSQSAYLPTCLPLFFPAFLPSYFLLSTLFLT